MRQRRRRGEVGVDHPLDRAGREHIAGLLEKRARIDRGLARIAGKLVVPSGVSDERLHVESLGIVVGGGVVADADQLHAPRREPHRGMRADVAEALHDRGRLGRRDVQGVEGAKGEKGDAVAGRLAPAQRAAGADRLAGHDLGHGDALVHRIGVHEPGHHLLVGADVRRHHVDPRADERDHLLHVAAGEVLELLGLERARIDRDPALAAAEGKIGERAFPAHPDRRARRSRRCRYSARSACRPWRDRAPGDAGPGSR